MAYLNIDTSAGTFSEIRRNNAYYIDKTPFLTELLRFGLKGKKLFTRPRRFGKSVMLSMVRDFLDISKDSRDIFKGLKIMEENELVEKYMNRYPVVFMSLKDVYGEVIEDVWEKLRVQMYRAAAAYSDVIDQSSGLDAYKKSLFRSVYTQEIESGKISDGLSYICDCLYAHYGKPAVVLIDEYDVPMARAYAYGAYLYDKVRNLIEKMLSGVCKENEAVQAVILTGCLYSIKGSTHTGVNNIKPFTLRSRKFSSYIGFTETEVEKLLSDAGLSAKLDLIREWYDGYLFGNTHIYCPWDVLNFAADTQDGEYEGLSNPIPKNYWVNTSGTMIDFIRGFLDKVPDAMNQFDRLLSGESIRQAVNENLPYHELQSSGENMWTALLEDGYLTMADGEDSVLRIPNKEVAEVMMQEIGSVLF